MENIEDLAKSYKKLLYEEQVIKIFQISQNYIDKASSCFDRGSLLLQPADAPFLYAENLIKSAECMNIIIDLKKNLLECGLEEYFKTSVKRLKLIYELATINVNRFGLDEDLLKPFKKINKKI